MGASTGRYGKSPVIVAADAVTLVASLASSILVIGRLVAMRLFRLDFGYGYRNTASLGTHYSAARMELPHNRGLPDEVGFLKRSSAALALGKCALPIRDLL